MLAHYLNARLGAQAAWVEIPILPLHIVIRRSWCALEPRYCAGPITSVSEWGKGRERRPGHQHLLKNKQEQIYGSQVENLLAVRVRAIFSSLLRQCVSFLGLQ